MDQANVVGNQILVIQTVMMIITKKKALIIERMISTEKRNNM